MRKVINVLIAGFLIFCITSITYAGTFQGRLPSQSQSAKDFGFDIMETFDDIQDWGAAPWGGINKTKTPHLFPKRIDGSDTPFTSFNYRSFAPSADYWIKDHRENGGHIWDPLNTAKGKSFNIDMSMRPEWGLGDGKKWGPDDMGLYFGDGNRTSGYKDEMFVFFMLWMPSSHWPTRRGNIFPVWESNKTYSTGDKVVPKTGQINKWYECITGGISGPNEPSWSTSTEVKIVDNGIIWQPKDNANNIGSYVKGENYSDGVWIKFITMAHGFIDPGEHGDTKYYEWARSAYGWHSNVIHFSPNPKKNQPELWFLNAERLCGGIYSGEPKYEDIKDVWEPNHLYSKGDKVISSSFRENPYFYEVINEGGISFENEPNWPKKYWATVTDNFITWECKGKSYECAGEHHVYSNGSYSREVVTNKRIPTDQWVGIEVHYKPNDPGKDNGVQELWYYEADGTEHHIITIADMFMRASCLQNDGMNVIVLGINNSNTYYWGPGMEPRWFVDDLIIDGNRIGPKYFAKKLQGSIRGDVNADSIVNVLDVQLCVNVVLGVETDADRVKKANVNGDGGVDVLDIQAVVNVILNST